MTSFKATHHVSNGNHELLLAHRGWVSELARQLVSDPFGAEDVAQETFLAALKAPPRGAGDPRVLRAWLARVARNLANLAMRRSDRLRARESEAARDEHVASAAETVERAAQHGRVVEAVLSLPEPYRATLLLRYFEGESYASIAATLGISEVAVRKRLSRGHQKLRAALEREYGSAQAWMAALIPLMARKGNPLAVSGAPLSTSVPLPFPLLAGGLVAGCVLGLAAFVLKAPVQEAAQAAPVRSFAVLAQPSDELVAPSYERSAVEQRERAGAGSDVSDASANVRGEVIDTNGRALGGLELLVEDPGGGSIHPAGFSAEDGSFALELTEGNVHILARGAGHATVRKSYVGDLQFPGKHVIVAAPLVDLGGKVVDAWGSPIEGATVELFVSDEAFSSLQIPLDRTADAAYAAVCSSRGEFELRGVPSARGLHLCASAKGWELSLIEVPEFSTARLEIVLDRPLLLAGREAATGHVDLQNAIQLAAASRSALEGAAFPSRLATMPGGAEDHSSRPAIRTSPPSTSELLTWNAEPGLAEGEKHALVAGRLLGPGGEPLANWLVHGRGPRQGAAFMVDAAFGRMACTRTDELGRFALPTEEGEFELQAYDPRTLQSVRSELPSETTGDVVLMVDTMTSRSISGRVISTIGLPLERIRVRATRVFEGLGRQWREYGAEVSTDETGFFVLRDLPREPIELLVDYDNVLPVLRSVPVDVEEVEIEVSQNAYMRIESGGTFDEIRALDGSGSELAMASSRQPRMRVRLLPDGRSPFLAVSSEIRTLVLYRDGVEVKQIPVDVFPGSWVDLGARVDCNR